MKFGIYGDKRTIHSLVMALVSALLMFIGGVIYLLWRSEQLWMFRWSEFLKTDGVIYGLRSRFPLNGNVPEWVIFTLPHCLWTISGMLIMISIWFNTGSHAWGKIVWVFVPAICAIGGEIGQLFGWVPGSFCLIDLIGSAVSTLIGGGIFMVLGSNENGV